MDSGQALGLRLAQREEAALEDAYTTYAPPLLSFVSRFVGPAEAEDVLQRTFIDVWRNAEAYDPQQRFTSWLFTIARRRAIDSLRTRRHDVVTFEQARELVGEDGRDTAERYADAADVHSALSRLPEHERVVIELAYFGGLTQTEIARELELPLGTVKARAARGTRRLGEIIRAANETPVDAAASGRERALAGTPFREER